MRKAIVRLTMAATVAVTLASDVAVAQTTVEQRIQVTGDPGGPIQLPGMMGGQRQFKTGTGRIRGRVWLRRVRGPIRRAQVRISGSGGGAQGVSHRR